MKARICVIILVTTALLALVIGCSSDQDEAPASLDNSSMAPEMVCSDLYQFLVERTQESYPDKAIFRGTTVELSQNRRVRNEIISQLKPEEWTAIYNGSGHWLISAIGAFDKAEDDSFVTNSFRGMWQYSESSGNFTPVNDAARNFMHWYELY